MKENRLLSILLMCAVLLCLPRAVAADGQSPENQAYENRTVERPAPAPPLLLADLKSRDVERRRSAANRLGETRASNAVRPLIDALSDKDAGVREASAFALGQIVDRRATEALIRALSDKVPEARASAAFALGMIGERKAIKPLSNALEDPSAVVRSSAITALGLMQDDDAVDEIIEMLNDSSFDVRYDAVWALGHIGEPEAEPHLQAALVSLDTLNPPAPLREAFRQTVQDSLERLRTREHAARSKSRSETRPRRSTDASGGTGPVLYSTTIDPPAVQQTVQPALTEQALRERASGSVGLRVLVGVTGRAERAYVTRRLGYGLDQRAVEAIMQYRFNPAMQAGLPQTTWIDFDVKF